MTIKGRTRFVLALGAFAAVLLTLTQPYGPAPSTALFVVAAVLVVVSMLVMAALAVVADRDRRLVAVRAESPRPPSRASAPDSAGRPLPRAPGDDDEFWSFDC